MKRLLILLSILITTSAFANKNATYNCDVSYKEETINHKDYPSMDESIWKHTIIRLNL